MGELEDGCSEGQKRQPESSTGGSRGAQRHGSKVGGGMGRVDSSGANWNLRLKDASSSLPLGLSSLRMSFSLF